jgi:hypothetical protein
MPNTLYNPQYTGLDGAVAEAALWRGLSGARWTRCDWAMPPLVLSLPSSVSS